MIIRQQVKRELNKSRSKADGRIKVGHGGTLDKEAEGVLGVRECCVDDRTLLECTELELPECCPR